MQILSLILDFSQNLKAFTHLNDFQIVFARYEKHGFFGVYEDMGVILAIIPILEILGVIVQMRHDY